MSKKKIIMLAVLLFCMVFILAMCLPKREQPKEEIIREYQKHQEAFQYIKEYFIIKNIAGIQRDSGKITIRIEGSSIITPLEDMDDELLVQYARLLFDDLHYFEIYRSYTWKTNVIQLMFLKRTNKTGYFKGVIYCRDNEPPITTRRFTDVEQIDKYWFYFEEDEQEL